MQRSLAGRRVFTAQRNGPCSLPSVAPPCLFRAAEALCLLVAEGGDGCSSCLSLPVVIPRFSAFARLFAGALI